MNAFICIVSVGVLMYCLGMYMNTQDIRDDVNEIKLFVENIYYRESGKEKENTDENHRRND